MTVNNAGGLAYSKQAEEALAQLAVTGTFNGTFYASGKDQLDRAKALAPQVAPEFLAQVAVYARTKGNMKDAPALFLNLLAARMGEAAKLEDAARKAGQPMKAAGHAAEVQNLSALLRGAFPKVIDNGKMLRNFVQIARSGATGRKSLGSAPQKLVAQWFSSRTPDQVFRQSVGNDPNFGDILAMVHPTPDSRERAALNGYLRGRDKARFGTEEFDVLDGVSPLVKEYEAFRKAPDGKALPKVPYEMLEGLPLTPAQWEALALQCSWQQLRQHLNTFERKGVFASAATTKVLAAKLADREEIRKARAMPYQLLATYLNTESVPQVLRNALQDAAEIATENIPVIDGQVAVLVDVSGSMHNPITGTQINPKTGKVESHTSKVRCIDVAALVAASVLRKNPEAIIIPFESNAVRGFRLNPRDSIMTNARRLMEVPAGGTNCSAAMVEVNRLGAMVKLAWYVSDNESWLDSPRYGCYSVGWGSTNTEASTPTKTMQEFEKLQGRVPDAKMVCMDITPGETTQAASRPAILNIGGFSDAVFEGVAAFTAGYAESWVEMIRNATSV